MEPIHAFVSKGPHELLLGDDPRNPHGQKAFSAAPIIEGERILGFYYIILGGQEFDSAVQMLEGSYIVRLGLRTMILTVLAASAIGLVAFAFVTRHLRRAMTAVRRFQEGDLTVRIAPSTTPEINALAVAFNDMADAIVRQIEEIRTLDALRRDLVANVSHDLRTPLVSIHGYVETILMKEHSITVDQQRSYLQAVLHSTERLKNLVEELLELSRLEARQTTPRLEPFSVGELVQDVVQQQRMQAENRGVSIRLSLPLHLPFVIGDIGLIERVLQNLVDNAIKYTTSPGTITISLSPTAAGVEVEIADTGEGIPQDELSHIFDRFRRGNTGTRGRISGAGLGLAIVKRILDLHHVRISVSSSPGRGTSFSFTLPRDETPLEVRPAHPTLVESSR
jgi:signal transduction histidine kinase